MQWEFHATWHRLVQTTNYIEFHFSLTIHYSKNIYSGTGSGMAVARLWYIWAFLRQVYQAKLWELYLISPLLLIFHHCYKFITIRADADYVHSSSGTQIVHVGLPEWV